MSVEILADRCDSLNVTFALVLVLCVSDLGLVTLGYMRPLKKHLMPVKGTSDQNSGTNNLVHLVALYLAVDPAPCLTLLVNGDASIGVACSVPPYHQVMIYDADRLLREINGL